MATVTGGDVATQFLADIGAPATAGNIRAVALWIDFEGSNIVGNNPWNLHAGPACNSSARYCPGQGSLPGQIGNRYAGPGDTNVAVFATLSDGIAANARNLANNPAYSAVVAALRRGDPLGFLIELAASPWSASHYGGNNGSRLTTAYESGTPYQNYVHNLLPGTSTGSGSGSGSSSGSSSPPTVHPSLADALGYDVTLSTPADITKIVAALIAHNPQVITGQNYKSASDLETYLIDFIGQGPRKASTIPLNLPGVPGYNASGNIDQSGPSVGDPLTTIAGVLGKLVDPQTWLGLLAFGVGAGMILWGVNRVIGATGGPSVSRPGFLPR